MIPQPKFIIETIDAVDTLIIGKCVYHKDLSSKEEAVKGGGRWYYNSKNEVYLLYGESFDYGPAKLEDIQKCIDNGRVGQFIGGKFYELTHFKLYYRDMFNEMIKLN